MVSVGGVTFDPGQIGVVAIVVLFGVALARGWIYTGPQVREYIHDRDEWRAEARIKDAQIAVKDEQLKQVAEVATIVKQLFEDAQSRRRASSSRDEGTGPG